jgi:hypothetical protein
MPQTHLTMERDSESLPGRRRKVEIRKRVRAII